AAVAHAGARPLPGANNDADFLVEPHAIPPETETPAEHRRRILAKRHDMRRDKRRDERGYRLTASQPIRKQNFDFFVA
ncbi:MAG: hypothetical protein ACRECA_11955, partial [Pseudolabrys sp.]